MDRDVHYERLEEITKKCDDVEDLLREMTENARNFRPWRKASKKLKLIPSLVYLHYIVRDMEIENTTYLDEINSDVSIEPLIHGNRIETKRLKLASRIRELSRHIGNFRQKLLNHLQRIKLRVPIMRSDKTNTIRIDLATRVSDIISSIEKEKLALSFTIIKEELDDDEKSSKSILSSSSSSSSSSGDSDGNTNSSSSSSSSDDEESNKTYENIIKQYSQSSQSWDVCVSDVVHMGDHMRYVFSIQAPDEKKTSWRLMYRFTAIKHFHRLLRSKSEIWKSTRFVLPTKGVFRSKNDPEVVEERCKSLTKMLNLLFRTKNMLKNKYVIQFLCSEGHMRSTVETEAGDLGVSDSLFLLLFL